jgi:hypothetical protein
LTVVPQIIATILGFSLILIDPYALIIPYFFAVLHAAVYLITGSIYVVKDGWVIILESQWTKGPRAAKSVDEWLGRIDSRFSRLEAWGQATQLVPEWSHPSHAVKATLVDLAHLVKAETYVIPSTRINAIVPLAIHGCGVTCLLLERPHHPDAPARKVGMVNLPPFILSQGKRTAPVQIARIEN